LRVSNSLAGHGNIHPSIRDNTQGVRSRFYFISNSLWRLSVQLIRRKADIMIASDFYSLAFCAAAARLWNAALIYDAREILYRAARVSFQNAVETDRGMGGKNCAYP